MLSKIRIDSHSMVELSLAVEYTSARGIHRDVLHIENFSMHDNAELLPPRIQQALAGKQCGYAERFHYPAGKLTQASQYLPLCKLPATSFNPGHRYKSDIKPCVGRFYPKSWFSGIDQNTADSMTPVRVVAISENSIRVDLNHPLAEYELDIEIEVVNVQQNTAQQNGDYDNYMVRLLNGPGMQLRYQHKATDFFSAQAFGCADDNSDALFYAVPRLINHLDDTALQQVELIYSALVAEDAIVLDLMSSLHSHLDESIHTCSVTGLGMNMQELASNTALSERLIHDLNLDPRLPFADDHFDVVVCTVSVEYLTQPLQVFEQVARVLKPGGIFITIVSNRWFPTKAINLWPDLHEFERMGLIGEYFMHGDSFANINTQSIRGFPRPENDPHPGLLSDPVYAVWGTKK